METIHIYGSEIGHDPVFIVGNKESIKSLVELLTAALQNNQSHEVFYNNDGEGYDIHIHIEENMDKMMLPYTNIPGITYIASDGSKKNPSGSSPYEDCRKSY